MVLPPIGSGAVCCWMRSQRHDQSENLTSAMTLFSILRPIRMMSPRRVPTSPTPFASGISPTLCGCAKCTWPLLYIPAILVFSLQAEVTGRVLALQPHTTHSTTAGNDFVQHIAQIFPLLPSCSAGQGEPHGTVADLFRHADAPAAHRLGSGCRVQAEPVEAQMPCISRSSRMVSPSRPGKLMLALPGRRCPRPPFRRASGMFFRMRSMT